MKRAGTLALLLAATGVSAVAGLGLLEAVVRYKEAHRVSVPGTMPFLYYRHARLGHALVRGMDYYGWVHINREGFRGREVGVVPPPGVIRIMAVGASTTMDGEVSRDDSAWPARLEYWLNREAPAGEKFEVVNAGVPGYRLIDNVIRFQTELFRYRPALILLFGATHNDLLAALAGTSESPGQNDDPRPDEMPTATPWARWLEQHSLLYNKVLQRWLAVRSQVRGARRQQGTPPASFERKVEAGSQDFGRDLTAFLALTGAAGIPVVIPEVVYMGAAGALSRDSAAIVSVWRTAVPFAPPGRLFEGYARYDSVIRSSAAAYGTAYLPTADSGLGARDLYAEGDPVHFNDRGADRMAKALAAELSKLAPWRPAATGAGSATPAAGRTARRGSAPRR